MVKIHKNVMEHREKIWNRWKTSGKTGVHESGGKHQRPGRKGNDRRRGAQGPAGAGSYDH